MERMTVEEAFDALEKFYQVELDDEKMKKLSEHTKMLTLALWTSQSVIALLPFVSLYVTLRTMKENHIEYAESLVNTALEPCAKVEQSWRRAVKEYRDSQAVSVPESESGDRGDD